MFEVRLVERYGKMVFESVQADAARKSGCLCVHTENGQTVMCQHLQANIDWEKQEKGSLRRSIATPDRSAEEIEKAINSCFENLLVRRVSEEMILGQDELSGHRSFFSQDGLCLPALMHFAACVTFNQASAITRCPEYKALEEKSSRNLGRCVA